VPPKGEGRPRNRRRITTANVLLAAGVVLLLWAIVITATGGFRIELGALRISSRNPSRILLLALLSLAIAWRLAYVEPVEAWLTAHTGRLRRLAPIAAWTAAGVFLFVGISCGSRAAAASDPFGYVSQSALWQQRRLAIDYKFAAALPWPEASQTLAPLGFKVSPDSRMVPTYAAGAPLLMAAGRLFTACGPFIVGPLCGAALILFTFYLGRSSFGAGAAIAAALLVACSPVVLFMALMPMADVPAAAFWTGALAFSALRTQRHVVAGGLLTGIAIAIRPNLAPLAVFPWLLAMTRVRGLRAASIDTLLFASTSLPWVGLVAWLNNHWYGSPLTSGYGGLSEAFSTSHVATNVRNYAAWWWESQGPLGFAFLLALVVRRIQLRHFLILAGFGCGLFLLYVSYLPFDAWWFLRFLLPAVPLAFLFGADAVQAVGRSSATARAAALAAFVVIAGAHATHFNDLHRITSIGAGEERYVQPALFIDTATPPDAIVFTIHHSGSIRYYAGRLTLRWDLLDGAWLDRTVEELRRREIPVYLLLEHFERQQFEERFKGQRTLAVLTTVPLASGRSGEQQLFWMGEGERPPGAPADIPTGGARHCRDMSPDFFVPGAIAKLQ